MQVKEVEIQFDLSNVLKETEQNYEDVDKRIKKLEKYIENLEDKKDIIDEFIAKAHGQLEATDSKNYKLRSQLQITISKQIELQQMIFDSIIKFEKTIHDYQRHKQEIQNSKINNYAKWKSVNKEDVDQKEFLEVLKKFEEATQLTGAIDAQGTISHQTINPLDQIVNSELEESGYKI